MTSVLGREEQGGNWKYMAMIKLWTEFSRREKNIPEKKRGPKENSENETLLRKKNMSGLELGADEYAPV